ncbi:unnamed protein product [Rotaria sp. Silwood1]|nr:unnamed protein product [Rotaria sp. Silwood1]
MVKWRFRSNALRLEPTTKRKRKRVSLFEWIQLIVAFAVPVAITVYTIVQTNNESSIAEENRRQDFELANKTRQNDLLIADNREKDTILNNYLNFLTKLLDKHGYNLLYGTTARSILQLNTLMVLEQLDPKRKSYLIRSFYENKLITHGDVYTAVIDLSSANLIQLDLNIHILLEFSRSSFLCVNAAQSFLTGSSFRNIDLSGSFFQRALMNAVDLSSTIIRRTHCDNGQSEASFSHTYLLNASFNKASYAYVDFTSATMDSTQLREFQCIGCDFTGVSLVGTDMSYAKFHLEPDLTILSKNNRRSIFVGANLTDSILYESHFNGSSFVNASLINSNMSRIKMNNIDFSRANLANVNFTHGQCHRCLFIGTNLTNIDFTNASLDESHFDQAFVTTKHLIRARSLANVIVSNEAQLTKFSANE